MSRDASPLRLRAKQFAVRVLRFLRTIRRDSVSDAILRQLSKSASSVSANYHSAGRSRSRAEFIARLGIVVDEADESMHWLSVLKETGFAQGEEFEWLLDESRQLRAIFSAALMTARHNQRDAN